MTQENRKALEKAVLSQMTSEELRQLSRRKEEMEKKGSTSIELSCLSVCLPFRLPVWFCLHFRLRVRVCLHVRSVCVGGRVGGGLWVDVGVGGCIGGCTCVCTCLRACVHVCVFKTCFVSM